MNVPTTVLIVELDNELAELERMILDEAGYRAIPTVCGPGSVQEVQKVNPDVIVLDLGFYNKTCGWQLLSALNANSDTQGIPLLVISDTEQLLEQAKLSFNVRQEMIKPYAIADLVKGVEAAETGTPLLPHPAPPPTAGPIPAEAAQVISRDAERIMGEWLRRAQQQQALGPRPNVSVRLLMNNISVWLIGLVSALRYGPGHLGTAEIHDKLADHIHKAEEQGLTLAEVIRQFDILRDVVWERLKHSSLANLTPMDVFELAQIVNNALDKVLAQVAEEYRP